METIGCSELIETGKEKEGAFNMLSVKGFFHFLFTFPEVLLVAVLVGLLVGVGSTGLYLARRLRHTAQQAWGQQVPRSIARYNTVSTLLGIIFIAGGLLLFFGILAGDFYFRGIILDSAICCHECTCDLWYRYPCNHGNEKT
jgi:hypothetical protein